MPEPPAFPLAGWADHELAQLARLSGSKAVGSLAGTVLLGERAMLNGHHVPGRISAGGGCRLFEARDDIVAVNLAREDDRASLPALFEDASFDAAVPGLIERKFARMSATTAVKRGRLLGMAVAHFNERRGDEMVQTTAHGPAVQFPSSAPPLVVDLSALWAGPLAGNLLALAGATVVKVESNGRPDSLRLSDPALFERLNGGKDSVSVDFRSEEDRAALLTLISRANIVIEASRPRALKQLGIDADKLVRQTPGLIWVSITAHGTRQNASEWVGFGDDIGVSAGLSAARLEASGTIGFVGDAIADPLTGIFAARMALSRLREWRATRLNISMSGVVNAAIMSERRRDPHAFDQGLRSWAKCEGKPFPPIAGRSPAGVVRPLGCSNAQWLETGAC